jgi:hypothetical protein
MRELRRDPRVGTEAMCWEGDRAAVVVDLSPEGLRFERPWAGPLMDDRVQLELELPEIDEIAWLGGEVCFDRRKGLVQTTGLRVISAAARDLRRIREYVMERARRMRAEIACELEFASCYARG